MTRFHVSIERRNWNKQIQTVILKVNTSEDIQKKVYTFFFPSVWILQSSLVSEKNKNGLRRGFDFKMTKFYEAFPSLCY